MNMDTTTTFFIEIALRSTLVLGAALLAISLMFRRSAAERHFILTLGIALLLLLPAGLLAMPAWRIGIWNPIQRVSIKGNGTSAAQPEAPTHGAQWRITTNTTDGQISRFPLAEMLAVILLLGTLAHGMRIVWGWCRLERMRRKARSFPLSFELDMEMGRADVLLSDDTRIAFVMGLLRPAIILPASAAKWSEGHLRMVLCHELGHLRRGDHWVQVMCCFARLLYWWQPLMWLCLRSLQRERELACDDGVVGRFRASDYAGLLLSIASKEGEPYCHPGMLAMAATSNLEDRICSVLDESRCRSLPRRSMCGLLSAAALAAGLLMCSARLGVAESQPVNPSSSATEPTAKPEHAAESKYVEIQSKFIEITNDDYQYWKSELDSASRPMDAQSFGKLLKALNDRKGVDLVSSPMVTTSLGKTAIITMGRDFRYPTRFEKDARGQVIPEAFETRTLGVELDISPTFDDGKIWLAGKFLLTEFEGFTGSEPEERAPVFDTKEAHLLRGLKSGEWACIVLPGDVLQKELVSEQLANGHAETSTQIDDRKMIVFLSAHLVNNASMAQPDGVRRATVLAPEASPKEDGKYAYGKPVPGKPGFVTSPYAPKAGYIDVRGYPKGTKVKDPYTKETFLVP